jgi:hypothetical protein
MQNVVGDGESGHWKVMGWFCVEGGGDGKMGKRSELSVLKFHKFLFVFLQKLPLQADKVGDGRA